MSLHKTQFSRLNYIIEYNPVWILHSTYQLKINVLLMMYINEDRGTIMVLIIKANTLAALWTREVSSSVWLIKFPFIHKKLWCRYNDEWTLIEAFELQHHKPHTRHIKKKKQPQTQYLMRFSCNFRFNTRTFQTGKYKNR